MRRSSTIRLITTCFVSPHKPYSPMASNDSNKRLKQTSIRDYFGADTRSGHNSSQTSQSPPQRPSTSNSPEIIFDSQDTAMTDLSEVPESPEIQPCLHVVNDDQQMDTNSDLEILNTLTRLTESEPRLPPLTTDNSNHILFHIPVDINTYPKPFPMTSRDKWDSRHVKMPNSVHNQIVSIETDAEGREWKKSVSKWEIIQETLLSDIKSPEQLVEAIKTYTPFAEKYKFDVLYKLFHEVCTPEERTSFFDTIMPKMVDLALNLPNFVRQSVPLLTQRQNSTLFLSQQQIASILANAFFCTFPKRSRDNAEYKDYQTFNFFSLYCSFGSAQGLSQKVEKLLCIINYFRRVTANMPKGVLSFERRHLTRQQLPDWNRSEKKLKKLFALTDGVIEREGKGLLQVDFANQYIGGGVLHSGCVQEEILFVICPELLVSLLFTEKLLDTEALIISGCEQYNTYSGYASTFQWEANFEDQTVRDRWGRRLTQIVAIDAFHFPRNESHIQYEQKYFRRELNKAFSGFATKQNDGKCAIASGNWGCGIFNGDPLLKAIIQLMAASEADRDLVLFTFNDLELELKLNEFYKTIIEKDFRVCDLYRCVQLYQSQYRHTKLDVIDFIHKNCHSKEVLRQFGD